MKASWATSSAFSVVDDQVGRADDVRELRSERRVLVLDPHAPLLNERVGRRLVANHAPRSAHATPSVVARRRPLSSRAQFTRTKGLAMNAPTSKACSGASSFGEYGYRLLMMCMWRIMRSPRIWKVTRWNPLMYVWSLMSS